MEYSQIDEDTFSQTLNEVLTNDSYRKKAKEMSVRFKDRPLNALDTAMFWIEYVIRNNGAHYMKNPAMELSWVAYTMFDVYAFVLILILVILYAILKVPMIIISLLSSKPSKKEKKKRT